MADPPAALPAHGGLLLTTTGGSATTLLRHATKLSAVTVGAGHIFCGDEQGEVCGWALHSLETVELSGEPHVGAVVALQAIAPTLNDPHRSQPLLFSAAADGIKAWDVANRACVASLHGHTAAVTSLAVSQGLLASASTDGELRWWELASHEAVASVAAHEAPIQVLAALRPRALLASACRGGRVHMWSVDEGGGGERVAVRVASLDAHGGAWA